jgi:hypothetical protein
MAGVQGSAHVTLNVSDSMEMGNNANTYVRFLNRVQRGSLAILSPSSPHEPGMRGRDDRVTERLNERRGTILGEVLELSRVFGVGMD